ncbi:MAG: lipopolysaccharide heptosyltransferase II [Candidatus Omnitrophota bacterium]
MAKTRNPPKKILIVRTDRLGDVILSTPVISVLRKNFPHAHIGFLCRPYTYEAVNRNPYLDEVIVYDKYGKQKSLLSTIKFAFFIRRKHFDWSIILHPTNRAHLISFIAGIPFRVGWDRKMGFLLSKRLPHVKQDGLKHESEFNLDILRSLSLTVEDTCLHFPLSHEAEKQISIILSNLKIEDGSKFVVIHPSASCPSKRWPQDNYSELVKMLQKKSNLKIIIITVKGEEGFGKLIVENNEVVDLRGKLTIVQTASLLKKAALFISNDSGPVHIAAAIGTPVISIFGRKDPGLSPLRWKPLGKNSYYIHKDAGCSECLAHNCKKGFLCLKKIAPQEVAILALGILNKFN